MVERLISQIHPFFSQPQQGDQLFQNFSDGPVLRNISDTASPSQHASLEAFVQSIDQKNTQWGRKRATKANQGFLQSTDLPRRRRRLSNDWDQFNEGGDYDDWETWSDNDWNEFNDKQNRRPGPRGEEVSSRNRDDFKYGPKTRPRRPDADRDGTIPKDQSNRQGVRPPSRTTEQAKASSVLYESPAKLYTWYEEDENGNMVRKQSNVKDGKLDEMFESCDSFRCYDCAYTKGMCVWDDANDTCAMSDSALRGDQMIKPVRADGSSQPTKRWFEWFDSCEDNLNICSSNEEAIIQMSGGETLSFALGQGQDAYYTIGSEGGTRDIPRNYYCHWVLDLDINKAYYLSIMRNYYPQYEELDLIIHGREKQQHVQNRELSITNASQEKEKYILQEADKIEIFARNKYSSPNYTFMFHIEQAQTITAAEAFFAQVSSMMFVLLCFCMCLSCCSIMVKFRGDRQQMAAIGNDGVPLDDRGLDMDEQEAMRQSRLIGAQHDRNRQSRRQQEEARIQAHRDLITYYEKMIPKMKYRKNNKEIDEFSTTECVICMDAFTNGARIRKIPGCKHILHDECLMKWLDGPTQQEQQKCPMCNAVISKESLEKALEQEGANPKKGLSPSRNKSPLYSNNNLVSSLPRNGLQRDETSEEEDQNVELSQAVQPGRRDRLSRREREQVLRVESFSNFDANREGGQPGQSRSRNGIESDMSRGSRGHNDERRARRR